MNKVHLFDRIFKHFQAKKTIIRKYGIWNDQVGINTNAVFKGIHVNFIIITKTSNRTLVENNKIGIRLSDGDQRIVYLFDGPAVKIKDSQRNTVECIQYISGIRKASINQLEFIRPSLFWARGSEL